jgi:hypothetical protein
MEPSLDSLKLRLDPLQAYSKPNNAAETLIHASSMRQTNKHQTELHAAAGTILHSKFKGNVIPIGIWLAARVRALDGTPMSP